MYSSWLRRRRPRLELVVADALGSEVQAVVGGRGLALRARCHHERLPRPTLQRLPPAPTERETRLLSERQVTALGAPRPLPLEAGAGAQNAIGLSLHSGTFASAGV